jgi:hypothetical protein
MTLPGLRSHPAHTPATLWWSRVNFCGGAGEGVTVCSRAEGAAVAVFSSIESAMLLSQ